jgi:hypothetical protein
MSKQLDEIRKHHASIKKVEARYLDFQDRISRNALLEYIEGTEFLLTRLAEFETHHAECERVLDIAQRRGQVIKIQEAALRGISSEDCACIKDNELYKDYKCQTCIARSALRLL